MSGKRIVVPEGMLNAAARDFQRNQCKPMLTQIWSAIEVALRWQSENPPVPSESQMRSVQEHVGQYPGNFRLYASEWVRRMYDAPEPEVPQEMLEIFWAEYSGGVRGPESERRIKDGLRAVLAWQKKGTE